MLDHLELFNHRAYYKKAWIYGNFNGRDFLTEDELVKVNPKSVCIYTGVQDRDGNKVYTSDIVKGYSKYFQLGVVRYLKDGGCFVLTGDGLLNVHVSKGYLMRCTVVGNVFESSRAKHILKQIKEHERQQAESK